MGVWIWRKASRSYRPASCPGGIRPKGSLPVDRPRASSSTTSEGKENHFLTAPLFLGHCTPLLILPIFFFCCRPADSVIVSFFFSTAKMQRKIFHQFYIDPSLLFCTRKPFYYLYRTGMKGSKVERVQTLQAINHQGWPNQIFKTQNIFQILDEV